MGIQMPLRFINPGVYIVHAARFRAGQEAEWIEVIPHNAFDFTVQCPTLAALTSAIVDSNLTENLILI